MFVLDSEGFKNEAWKIILAPYGEKHEIFLTEARKVYGAGKSGGRLEIFGYIFRKLGRTEDELQSLVANAGKEFDEYVQYKIIDAGLVFGVVEMLESLSAIGIPLYVNSGTATVPLIKSVANLRIGSFFKEILGSTKEPFGGSKVENLQFVAKQENISISEILMIGDSDSDFAAAKEAGCHFLGVSNHWNKWGNEELFPTVTDLRDVASFL